MVLYSKSTAGRYGRHTTVYPIFYLAVADRIMYTIACAQVNFDILTYTNQSESIPGPLAAVKASSPIKKSKSSVPLFADSAPPCPVPPVRNEGLLATAGLPDPEPAVPPAGPLVAIAVGKTNEGESLPANPSVC